MAFSSKKSAFANIVLLVAGIIKANFLAICLNKKAAERADGSSVEQDIEKEKIHGWPERPNVVAEFLTEQVTIHSFKLQELALVLWHDVLIHLVFVFLGAALDVNGC